MRVYNSVEERKKERNGALADVVALCMISPEVGRREQPIQLCMHRRWFRSNRRKLFEVLQLAPIINVAAPGYSLRRRAVLRQRQ